MSGSPRGRLGRNILVAAAGSVILAAAAGGGLWARSDRHESSAPAVQAAAAVPPVSAGSLAIRATNGGYTPHTVYIVGSEEQAASVLRGINDANVIRDSQNLPPLLDEVVVASSDEEASAIMAGENDSNAILAALYRVENRIVNLRG
jgi:hypothetical protein